MGNLIEILKVLSDGNFSNKLVRPYSSEATKEDQENTSSPA
jgi:hypothetical protein